MASDNNDNNKSDNGEGDIDQEVILGDNKKREQNDGFAKAKLDEQKPASPSTRSMDNKSRILGYIEDVPPSEGTKPSRYHDPILAKTCIRTGSSLPMVSLVRHGPTGSAHHPMPPGAYPVRHPDAASSAGDGDSVEPEFINHESSVSGGNDLEAAVLVDNVVDEAVLVEPSGEATVGSEDLMVEQEEQEVIDGEIMIEHETRYPKESRKATWVLVSVLVIAAGLVVFVAVFFSIAPGTSEEGKGIHAPESVLFYPVFQDGLPLAAIKEMEIVASPLYLANRWMHQDPNLQSYSEQRQRQRFLLASFYFAMGGDHWFRRDGWMDYSIPECDWYSSTSLDELKGKPICDEDHNMLILGLASNNLQGEAPVLNAFRNIDFVPQLYAFDVAHNNITGYVPSLHSTLSMEITVVSNNSFTNLGPGNGLTGSTTRILKIDSNQIRATARGYGLPLLTKVEVFNLTGNFFKGTLHPNIQYCTSLTYVGFGNNLFEGNIPSEFGLLTRLETLDLSGNLGLEGAIPTELGVLVSQSFSQLDVSQTQITGPLPPEMCRATQENSVFRLAANCSLVDCGC